MARERSPRTYTLRRASSVVFALISVLPLLLFAYTLYALNVLQQTTAQIGLGSALALAMIGLLRFISVRADPLESGHSRLHRGPRAQALVP